MMPPHRTKVDFYHDPTLPECRAVMLTAKAVGVELEYRPVDLKAGELINTAFEIVNPQRTVPTIIDKGFSLSESKAICAYLVNKYSPDSLLYPQRPENRAVIDQRLAFDTGSLTRSFHALYDPCLYFQSPMQECRYHEFLLALQLLDRFLLGNHWVAGHHLTLADICMVCVVNTAEACDLDLDPYRNIRAWLVRCKTSITGYEEMSREGLKTVRELFSETKQIVPIMPWCVQEEGGEGEMTPEPEVAPVAEAVSNECTLIK